MLGCPLTPCPAEVAAYNISQGRRLWVSGTEQGVLGKGGGGLRRG